ncbi:MAG: alpha-glucan family phosphorylase [Planctomycetaceae bacterium]|nr:alpha-glucan family phosphorylase [Planctomycetaceae bacterium]
MKVVPLPSGGRASVAPPTTSTPAETTAKREPAPVRLPVTPATATPSEGVGARLEALARNMWWTWQPDVGQIFRELDPVRWRQLNYNPLALLSEFSPQRLEHRAAELVLHSRVNYAYRRLQEYLSAELTWGTTHAGVLKARPVAYFSAEFGIHESLPIYSGGLGVLAGDHVKSASDLGVPLVGIGLFYNQGYFHQRLDRDLWQQEEYADVEHDMLPIAPALDASGQPVVVEINTRHSRLLARLWRVEVGRTTLLLLDADVDGNRMEDRELTSRLYGGDHRVRIRQELLLGVGGMRALTAMGIVPGVLHLNEGHSAFAALELARQRMHDDGLSFYEAQRLVALQTAFTTHTPVAAGHDRFTGEQIEEHLGPLRDELGISYDELMALGRETPHDHSEPFCMTVLCLKMSRQANAVSAEHGRVSRKMWEGLFPGRATEEIPIGHITNGVHVGSWLAGQMHRLYDRHFGVDWATSSGEPEIWARIDEVDDGELWETHQVLKGRMLDFVRRRAVAQGERRGDPPQMIEQARQAMRTDALTIGFGRRFATYKRATLILADIEKLAEMVNDPRRPIQLIFAGKAHPHDEPGKRLLWEIARLTRDPRFAGRFLFVEDYDMSVGRHLVQGVDVWLNNPRRPMEASGTSGQKVVLNGGLNLSVLDGWWTEAYDGSNGFAIGQGNAHRQYEVQDARDAKALHETLIQEVIPLYYDRDRDGLPRAWIKRMKRAIRTLGWRFNADRMVMDYTKYAYVRAAGGLSCDMPR